MTTGCHQQLGLCQNRLHVIPWQDWHPWKQPKLDKTNKNITGDLAFRGVSNLVHKTANYHDIAVSFVKSILKNLLTHYRIIESFRLERTFMIIESNR